MRVKARWFRNFRKETRRTSNLERSHGAGGGSAACWNGSKKESERRSFEGQGSSSLFELVHKGGGSRQDGLRGMGKCVRSADAVGASKGRLRFFHLGAHGMQVIAGRNYRKQKNEGAAEGAHEAHRMGRCGRVVRTRRGVLSLPEKIGWHQKRKPTKIEKKLHSKSTSEAQCTPAHLDVTTSRYSG